MSDDTVYHVSTGRGLYRLGCAIISATAICCATALNLHGQDAPWVWAIGVFTWVFL